MSDIDTRLAKLQYQVDYLMSLEAQSRIYGVVNPSGTQSLTTSYADLAGLTFTFTPLTDETVYLFVMMLVNQANGTAACNAGDVLNMQVLLDGAAQNFGSQTEIATLATGATGGIEISSYMIISSGITAGSSHTIKAQVKNTTGARGQASDRSQFYYLRASK